MKLQISSIDAIGAHADQESRTIIANKIYYEFRSLWRLITLFCKVTERFNGPSDAMPLPYFLKQENLLFL